MSERDIYAMVKARDVRVGDVVIIAGQHETVNGVMSDYPTVRITIGDTERNVRKQLRYQADDLVELEKP